MRIFTWCILATIVVYLATWEASAQAATSCNDWATVAKNIAIRFRGVNSQTPRLVGDVKAELRRIKNGDPEMDYALKWVDFTYAHPELSPNDIWSAVNRQCSSEYAI